MSVFTLFNPEEDIITNGQQRNTYGMWSNNSGSLTAFYTSSTQSGSSGKYYYDVYNDDPAASASAEVQFAVAYGNLDGLGFSTASTDNYPTKATYYQYRNTLLDPADTYFTFAGSVNSDDIWVINIERARYRRKVDPGNWEIIISGTGGQVTLIDDSGGVSDSVSTTDTVYNIVSGALDLTNNTSSIVTPAASEPSGGYGLFYPVRGVLILNPTALSHSIGVVAGTGSVNADNAGRLLGAIQSGSSFYARSEEWVNSTHYFVRVKSKAYNFSNNPSFYTSSGYFRHQSMNYDPQVYITTVGLYNDGNELVAVAKLSQPYLKNFDREALIKVRLDY